MRVVFQTAGSDLFTFYFLFFRFSVVIVNFFVFFFVILSFALLCILLESKEEWQALGISNNPCAISCEMISFYSVQFPPNSQSFAQAQNLYSWTCAARIPLY